LIFLQLLEPSLIGFRIDGKVRFFLILDSLFIIEKLGVFILFAVRIVLVISLSIPITEARMPEPVYFIFNVSRNPCIEPSSPPFP